VLLAIAGTASAEVCVALDESRDTLGPDDRRAATISFGQALAKAGVQATNTNCTETYTFYNVKLGESITVYVVAPTGTRQGRASKLDELPLVYEQLTHSIVSGQPMGSIENVDRTNATVDQMAPRRVSADGLKYVRLGYGAVTGKSTDAGTAIGFGYRYELDQLAVDVSFFNIVWASQDTMDQFGNHVSRGGLNGEWVRLGLINYQQPLSTSSLYYGGGLGYGSSAYFDVDNGGDYSGSGLQLSGVAGYEMLRSSTIRMFLELNVTAPLYKASPTFYSSATETGSSRWAPVASLTFGLGLGHSNAINVVNR
jgi:hypothetical protein